MHKYVAQWRYTSSLGTFDKGDEVLLTEDQAKTFNKDSPGVLLLVPDKQETNPAMGRAMTGPPRHRMMTGAETEKRVFVEPPGEVFNATDAAVALADKHGINLAGVTGSGAGGRILKSDIERLVEQP